jgi:hypothetical protein
MDEALAHDKKHGSTSDRSYSGMFNLATSSAISTRHFGSAEQGGGERLHSGLLGCRGRTERSRQESEACLHG